MDMGQPYCRLSASGQGGVGFRTVRLPRQIKWQLFVASFYVKKPYKIVLQQNDGTITKGETESVSIDERMELAACFTGTMDMK